MAQDQQHWSEPIRLLNQKLPLTPPRRQRTKNSVTVLRPPAVDEGKPTSEGFRVGALNVNSIKSDDRRNKVECFVREHKFDIFVVIESKLHITDKFEHPNNYAIERKDRRYEKKHTKKANSAGEPTEPNPLQNRGGGILIYIHEPVNYKVKSRGEYAESNVEFLHIEITSPVKLHLVALYSPHKKLVDHLISLMSYFMDPLKDRNIMFIGDTNIDKYGVQPQDDLGNTFFDVLEKSYGVKQLIDQITHDNACIDHIFTNMEHLERGVMENCITPGKDHKGIYCTLQDTVLQRKRSKSKAFMRKCGQVLKDDTCILAIFYKFPKKVAAPAVVTCIKCAWSMDEELAYCQVVSKERDMNSKMDNVDKFATKVEETEEMRQHGSATLKQCIIFTRNSRSPVFHALQKEMWYKDWDFVWQPRHVEFLGYVLEPSLTYAYTDGDTIWDRPQQSQDEEIALQESTYRYRLNGGTSIEKL